MLKFRFKCSIQICQSIHCATQNTETVIQMFRQPTAVFISEELTLTGMNVKIQLGSQTMMWSRDVYGYSKKGNTRL